MKKAIVSFSGGIGSYLTLRRCLAEYGQGNVEAVFCDTLAEDGDTYRFIDDVEAKLGLKIIRLCAGKTPLELCFEHKFIYNTRIASCSVILKSKPFAAWLKPRYKPNEAAIAMGIDWSEKRRCAKIAVKYSPYEVLFPMCEPPYLRKEDMLSQCEMDGLKPPRMYSLGFQHSNCGGCCVKGGIGHFLNLLRVDPIRYRELENKEERLRDTIGKDVAILKRGGKPLTLRVLRKEAEAQGSLFDF